MEENGKKINPYRGIWIGFLALLGFPAICFVIFLFSVEFYIALAFASLVGFIFGLMCIVAGFTKDLFRLLGDRIQETHEMFGFFSKEGFKWYVHRFIDDGGPILWLFLLIVVGFAFTSAFSFIKLYYMYQPYF